MVAFAALNAPVNIADRPITQQGLSGMKTGVRRQTRMVQDKTYFLGLLRYNNNMKRPKDFNFIFNR